MVKLSKYLVKDFLLTFSVAMLLVTFAFSVGALYKAVDIMAKGFPIGTVGQFFVNNLPYSVAYTIPISALFSTLLLFGRLSADSEISAMKSGGLSLWQIASPILLVTFGLMLFCFYNNFVVYPQTTYKNRQLIKTLGVEDPIKLLEEGRYVRDFPGWAVYVAKKKKNEVLHITAHQLDKESGRVILTLRADRGSLNVDKQAGMIDLELDHCRMEVPDPEASNDEIASIGSTPSSDKVSHIRLNYNQLLNTGKKLIPKRKNMQFPELAYRVRNPEKGYEWLNKVVLDERERARVVELNRGQDLIEINQRICLSIAPFMFVLIAIPLGIKSHRKESSAGMLVSLAVVFIYYIFIILSDTLDNSPALHPWLLPWVPIIGGQIAAVFLLRRAE